MNDWPGILAPIWITLKLAFISSLILMIIGTPLAWWLAITKSKLKPVVESIVAIPLVLPPTVLGFYLLITLGPSGAIGAPLEAIGIGHLAFTFTGLVIGSVIFSLPFVTRPLQNAFEAIGPDPLETAATLRARPLDRFFSIAVPLARSGFLTALVLGFAHTVGEFGVVLMIGGNIPGKTEVLSIAIYNHVEAMEYTEAHIMSAGLVIFSFVALIMVSIFNRRLQ
ncbi:Molybdenum ABC transporter permease protein ModB [hydrothermal vent metagenome]|uniref:Molybdenum ABC transporter permease protein ModB n=1 Tax=hydrothermal vent metagenome TaxID=652676 RepID=A0A3B1BZ57_9ZZZZ